MGEVTKWKCPKCGAAWNKHGKGVCLQRGTCEGLVCECEEDEPSKLHGETAEDPCPEATCYHCGWGGMMPYTPEEDMKSWPAWAKTAVENGWVPPKKWRP